MLIQMQQLYFIRAREIMTSVAELNIKYRGKMTPWNSGVPEHQGLYMVSFAPEPITLYYFTPAKTPKDDVSWRVYLPNSNCIIYLDKKLHPYVKWRGLIDKPVESSNPFKRLVTFIQSKGSKSDTSENG